MKRPQEPTGKQPEAKKKRDETKSAEPMKSTEEPKNTETSLPVTEPKDQGSKSEEGTSSGIHAPPPLVTIKLTSPLKLKLPRAYLEPTRNPWSISRDKFKEIVEYQTRLNFLHQLGSGIVKLSDSDSESD